MKHDTIPRQFLESVRKFDKPDAFRFWRDGRWVNVSHGEMFDRVYHVALGLAALKLARGDRVAVLSENRLEWAIADLAILSCGCVNVPVYATLPAKQVEYILRDSEARVVFVSNREQLEKVQAVRRNLPLLQTVICFDRDCADDDVLTLEAIEERGRMTEEKPDYEAMVASIGRNDWASIIYTSGTTGEPKGVILTHWNFMSNVHAGLDSISVGPDDACLSFLPLSHSFERTAGYYVMLTAGVTVAYARSIETVGEDMLEVRPTVMCSVPRLYEKMYARILDAVEQGSGIKQGLFRWAVSVGRRYVNETLEGGASASTRGKRSVADALVFRKLKQRTGGRMRFFVSGGAPLSREIAEFFYAAGLPILEGYGLTETSPIVTVNTFEHFRFGTVGRPIPGVEVRIADDGEILVRGPNVMQGYYKRPDDTARAIVDGWFHTGDIGRLEDGFLVITDRKKDIIVTAGGKNVAPQPIENALKQSPWIAEAILVGDAKPFVVALIVPNFEKLEAFARQANIPFSDHRDLVASERVRELIQQEIDSTCAHLASFETPHRFALLDRELTLEDGELTPSLKVKRRVVMERFGDLIDELYAGH